MTSLATSGRKLWKFKTVENAASDGFRSNFSVAAFSLPHQLAGFLFTIQLHSHKNNASNSNIKYGNSRTDVRCRKERPRKLRKDNIKKLTGRFMSALLRIADDRIKPIDGHHS